MRQQLPRPPDSGVLNAARLGSDPRRFLEGVQARFEDLAAEWRADPGERNVHAEMTALTIRVASEILLGNDIGHEAADEFHGWMQTAGSELEFSPATLAPEFLDPTSKAFQAVADDLRAMAEDIIERRRESLAEEEGADGEEPRDMLAMLLRAEERGVEMPPNGIRDEVLTFLIAGHETTALSLTYAWALLSWHPEARERIREEAREVLGDGTPRHEHVRDLDYTQRAFREALRLYPAAWAVFRSTEAEVRLGDYAIPPSASVVLPQWSVHRDPRYFEDPDEFDPDRWTRRRPGNVEACFPFSSGPHACIGQAFSLSGATLVLAGLAREFDVGIAGDALSDLRATATLRPADAVPGRIEPVD